MATTVQRVMSTGLAMDHESATALTLRRARSGSPPGNRSVGGKAFKVDLSDTATLELITFAANLSKEMYPDPDRAD